MKTIYLTFDLDWAIDEVIVEFLEMMQEYDICGVLHVTHQTPYLDIIRKDKRIELGIHPNYNPILLNQRGDINVKSIDDVLRYIKGIVPEAVCCRSHALTSGSLFLSRYKDFGLRYDLNHYIPPRNGTKILPYKPEGLDVIVLPFIFEDDAWMIPENKDRLDVDFYLGNTFEAPRIFNFHPIHLFLNTDRIDTFNKAKEKYKDYKWISDCRNVEKYGIRDFFLELVERARDKGWKFGKISDTEWM